MEIYKFYENYNPIGDIITFILCITIFLLRTLNYSKKDTRLTVFTRSINLLTFSSMLNIVHYVLLSLLNKCNYVTLTLRILYYICISFIFMNFVRYIIEIFEVSKHDMKILEKVTIIPGLIIQIYNICLPILNTFIKKEESILFYENILFFNFIIEYIYYIFLLLCVLIHYKNLIMNKILRSFLLIAFICITTILVSFCCVNISYITFTFFIPLMGAYSLLHNNPYNVEIGTLDSNAFENYLSELSDKHKKFTLLCLYLNQSNNTNCMKYIKENLNKKYGKIFSNSYLFKLNDKRYALILEKKETIDFDYISDLDEMLNNVYDKFKIDYKLTFIQSDDLLDSTKNYIKFDKYLESINPINSIYYCTKKDINDFIKNNNIIEELHNISKTNDLEDERVLVYCQPVFNILTKKYDTAEVLMRLKLSSGEIIHPTIFIPLAEKEDYIHTLSLITLNKTCKKIKELELKGLSISRISVNFSILELKQNNFCNDILNIIVKNEVSFEKIAIELTESRNENDFSLIKEKIQKLKNLGIYFYLDDFGTGYSNFDRIMELPIDVIKFDRSLVLMSNKDKKYQYMVKNFSNIFKSLKYKILFEGIENENDENMCIEMNANYLQGYKYSKPIPLNEIDNFLN